jgi:hypothetical protein
LQWQVDLMKLLHKTITAMLALVISAPSSLIRLLSKQPAVRPHLVEMQHPVRLDDGGDREQEHNHLEAADSEPQEHPAISIAVPFVPDDDAAWQMMMMAATNTQLRASMKNRSAITEVGFAG